MSSALTGEMERIVEANDAAGHHFFEAGAMRFFNSTLHPRVYGGRYFITGERREAHRPERFTIRVALDNGHVNTVGGTSRRSPAMRTPRRPCSRACSAASLAGKAISGPRSRAWSPRSDAPRRSS